MENKKQTIVSTTVHDVLPMKCYKCGKIIGYFAAQNSIFTGDREPVVRVYYDDFKYAFLCQKCGKKYEDKNILFLSDT